jgi:hypothetical protein
VLFGGPIDVKAVQPWAISLACLIIGGTWLRFEAAGFHRVWQGLRSRA